MKRSPLLLAVALFCATAVFAQQSTEVRTPGSFTSLNIAGGFERLVLKSGSKESVELITDGTDLSKVVTEIKGNSLNIHMKEGHHKKDHKITVIVTYATLKALNTSGSTEVVVKGTFKADEFDFNASGSGSLSGTFEVKDLEINIAGSADVTLKGKAAAQHIAISGSGNVDAAELSGETAEVSIAGSGDVTLNVSGKVKSSIAGSGHIDNKKSQ